MRYVPIDDSAWLWSKIDAEVKELGDEKSGSHPYWVYFSGATRFDLDDPAIKPYLDPAQNPETWRFSRLSLECREQCEYMKRHGRIEAANRQAFLQGVVGLDNPGNMLGEKLSNLLQGERNEAKRAQIIEAAEDYAASVVDEVGAACLRGSQDLTAIEKKL